MSDAPLTTVEQALVRALVNAIAGEWRERADSPVQTTRPATVTIGCRPPKPNGTNAAASLPHRTS